MDKTAIKNFAIEARKILMKSAITEAGFYGITKDGCLAPIQKGNDFEVYKTLAGTENRIYGDDIKRRANLVKAIEVQGFDQVIEETAYTWFNRIIAIRFMEVNNYLPTRVRVLSSETGSGTPDIITQADTVELNLTSDELDKIQTAKRENKYDEAFRLLFVKQCNELNEILPGLFEKTNDYMELLLKITYTGDGVVRMLLDSIPEDNFNVETEGQVEIIGWMYQYYNTELKDDTFAKLKKNVKITKERIPAATQLFTPDWIVRYMVENSLGRVWIEHLRAVDASVDEKAKAEEFGWKYYLPEAEQEADVASQLIEIRKNYRELTPQDITCIDPCMGSGHILVYMFDVLMDIYRSEGFSEREAVFDILEKNIRGLDIDRRAYQLSYFALMMKARGYNRIFFRGKENIDGERVQAEPQVYAVEESNNVNKNQLKYFGEGLSEIEINDALNQLNGLLSQLVDAKEYGSILILEKYNWELLLKFVDNYSIPGQMDFEMIGIEANQKLLRRLIRIGKIIEMKYDAVVTNPPYMNLGDSSVKLNEYTKKHYPDTKSDLYAVFIEKCMEMASETGFVSMITQQTWMFLGAFEKLRIKILKKRISTFLQLGPRSFDDIGGEVVQSASFVINNAYVPSYKARYFKLTEEGSSEDKKNSFLKGEHEHIALQDNFNNVPSSEFAFWLSEEMFSLFANSRLSDKAQIKSGMSTSDNNRFLRVWFEVERGKIGLSTERIDDTEDGKYKWYPYNKGGSYRKWYGNIAYVVNWESNGKEIKYFVTHNPKDPNTTSWSRRIFNIEYSMRESLSWSKVSSGMFALRYYPQGFMFDVAGPGIFIDDENRLYVMGLLNSKLSVPLIKELYPTLNYETGQIGAFPILIDDNEKNIVNEKVAKCIELARDDWNLFELSWDFKCHPVVSIMRNNQNMFNDPDDIDIKTCYDMWEKECFERFSLLKKTEEELNEIFIDIYGLRGVLSPEVDDKDVSIRKADLARDVRSFISYAVGCMFGRYSLDKDGLIYAGGSDFDEKKYCTFTVDRDAIIPITDEKYFDDDIVSRFEEFICHVFGKKSKNRNLEFIATALNTKGSSAEEKIRNYFLNDFFADHCNAYSVTGSGKRPIYWQFDSGKQNGFKCLIYVHRYNQDMVGIIRSDYLVKAQSMIENSLKNVEYAISTSASAVDKAQATKKRDKYLKQLSEIRSYYSAISHIALQRIPISLDDGVKVNYAKFQNVEISTEGEKKQTIDLLTKI